MSVKLSTEVIPLLLPTSPMFQISQSDVGFWVRSGGPASKLHVESWVLLHECLWNSQECWWSNIIKVSLCLLHHVCLGLCLCLSIQSCDPAANFTKNRLGTSPLRVVQCQLGLLWSQASFDLPGGAPVCFFFSHLLLVFLWWGWGSHYAWDWPWPPDLRQQTCLSLPSDETTSFRQIHQLCLIFYSKVLVLVWMRDSTILRIFHQIIFSSIFMF